MKPFSTFSTLAYRVFRQPAAEAGLILALTFGGGAICTLAVVGLSGGTTVPPHQAAETTGAAPSQVADTHRCKGENWPYVDLRCGDEQAVPANSRRVRVVSTGSTETPRELITPLPKQDVSSASPLPQSLPAPQLNQAWTYAINRPVQTTETPAAAQIQTAAQEPQATDTASMPEAAVKANEVASSNAAPHQVAAADPAPPSEPKRLKSAKHISVAHSDGARARRDRARSNANLEEAADVVRHVPLAIDPPRQDDFFSFLFGRQAMEQPAEDLPPRALGYN